MKNILVYIVALMIFWDLSIHIIELAGLSKKFTQSKSKLSYYYPHFYWQKSPNGPQVRPNWGKLYQRFWVAYWSIALLLLIIFIVVGQV